MSPRTFFETVDSTQERALALARGGAPPGTLVVAREQSFGLGRLDHAWVSPLGGLYLSVVLRPPRAAPHLLPLALAAGVRALLRERYGVTPHLKWPNDLLFLDPRHPPRKVAGVLVAALTNEQNETCHVAGIGLNALTERSRFPADLRDRVAILSELTPRPIELGVLEDECVAVARAAVEELDDASGALQTLRECRSALYGRGRPALVDGVPGGVIEEIAEDGSLQLRSPERVVALYDGDVTVVEAT